MIVICYVMDSVRPDFLSCYGYSKETSPHIDRLAREGVLFTEAFAQSTWTRPSGASLLTSTYPSVHRILTLDDRLPVSIPTLPEELKKSGYKTIALSAMGNISPAFGFGRGFDHFVELYRQEKVIAKREKVGIKEANWEMHFRIESDHVPIATSEDVNEFLYPFLEDHQGGDLFVFIWSIDTHSPYFHRDAAMARFSPPHVKWSPKEIENVQGMENLDRLKALYEDMIYYNDHHLGKLITTLKEMHLFDQTFLILTSDHGEAFGEHGVNSHAGPPFDEQIRVPLIIKFPHSEFSGKVSGLVQLIDVAPTILEYVAVRCRPPSFQGASLIPLLNGEVKVNEHVFSEFHLKTKLPKFVSLRTTGYKYIEIAPGKLNPGEWWRDITQRLIWCVAKPRMLFSLREDPGEKLNLAGREKKTIRSFHRKVKELIRRNRALSAQFGKEKRKSELSDKGVAQQLKALGYFDGEEN